MASGREFSRPDLWTVFGLAVATPVTDLAVSVGLFLVRVPRLDAGVLRMERLNDVAAVLRKDAREVSEARSRARHLDVASLRRGALSRSFRSLRAI